jgi:chemotaxis protein MotB
MGAKKADPPPGAPDWIVTFADMISLLVTFFILLMTFSSLESFDFFRVKGNNVGTPGVVASIGASSSQPPPELDIMCAKDALRGAQIPHSRPSSELLEGVSDLGAKDTDEHEEIDLSALMDGIHIQYDERAAFKPGSIELSPYLSKAIKELAGVLEHYPYTVIFEGHTDSAFRKTGEFPSEDYLSVARAEAVAHLALSTSELNPLQVQIAGHGSDRPLQTNDTPDGRRMNRRVEVRVMSLSKRQADALKLSDRSDG